MQRLVYTVFLQIRKERKFVFKSSERPDYEYVLAVHFADADFSLFKRNDTIQSIWPNCPHHLSFVICHFW